MSDLRIVVLDAFAADQGDAGAWAQLRALGEVTVLARTPAERLTEAGRDADAVITNKAPITAALIAALPRLRYIGVSATGTNIVDLEAARARGIAVTNVPAYAAQSVAQLAMAMVLHFAVDVAGHSAAVKSGGWAASPDFCFFLRPLPQLAGRTLVLVGHGAIGGALSTIARGFGMKVIAAAVPGSPTPGRVPLLEAVAQADVLSLHCPLTPRTAGLVNAELLAALPPSAILINTSRGGLIDEGALVAALTAGKLGGVGLDVLSQEPPPADHPLCDPKAPWAARVLITPHIGWGTAEARARLRATVAENLLAFVGGQRLNRVD